MNLISLDNKLRAVTNSEARYRDGIGSSFFDTFPREKRNGKEVIFMNFATTNSNVACNSLSVKKHSRFQACPLHLHGWVEINYMYSGVCPQTINDTSHILKKGQVILIDTETPHATDWVGEDDIMISLLIEKNYLNTNFFNRLSKDSILSQFFINAITVNTSHNNYIVFHSEHSRRLPIFFNELLCEVYDPSLNSTDIINSLFSLIISELINVYENDINKEDLHVNKTSVVPIIRYIEGNSTTCTLESTAKFFNMNPNYLTTLLKQHTGHSYKELVQLQRLTSAAKLIRNSGMPITSIANHVGYENMSFFYKKFKEKYGCSPKEFRNSL